MLAVSQTWKFRQMRIFCLSFLSKRHQPESRIVWAMQETAWLIRKHLEIIYLFALVYWRGLRKTLSVSIINVPIIETFLLELFKLGQPDIFRFLRLGRIFRTEFWFCKEKRGRLVNYWKLIFEYLSPSSSQKMKDFAADKNIEPGFNFRNFLRDQTFSWRAFGSLLDSVIHCLV